MREVDRREGLIDDEEKLFRRNDVGGGIPLVGSSLLLATP